MIEVVFFDAGGTLIHTDPRTWLPGVLGRFDEEADWSRLPEVLPPLFYWYDEAHLAADTPEKAVELWREFDRRLLLGLGVKRAKEIADWLVEHWAEEDLWPRTPGTPEVIHALKARGFRLAVVSNWDVLLPEILRAMGLDGAFEAVVVSAALGVKKPHPEIYRAALDAMGVAPERVLFVGDRPDADVEAPKKLGMQALQVTPETGLWPVLERLASDR